jgi:tetratricopeptide (TPR) repeat protein
VGPIIRICNALALVLMVAPPGAAVAKTAAPSALSLYVKGRSADFAGALEAAANAYSAALAAEPGNQVIAIRAYRQAVEAGDWRLAQRAAAGLQAGGVLPPDARLMMFSIAVRDGDWRSAGSALDKIEREGGFDFLVPILRAWLTVSSHDGDPVALLALSPKSSLTSAYLDQSRTLILLNRNKKDDGVALKLASDDVRTIPFRLSLAAKLLANGDKARATDALRGKEAPLVRASTMVAGNEKLPGALDSAANGAAFLFARVSHDLMRDRTSPAALTLSRFAALLDPGSDDVRLVLARALAGTGNNDAALAQIEMIPANSLWADTAREAKIAIFERTGKFDQALALAQAAAAVPAPSAASAMQLGGAFSRLNRHVEAAQAYNGAIKAIAKETGDASVPWALWLQFGSALQTAGQWERAKDALERAVTSGPEQPLALNHLGYSLLERHEQIDRAWVLIKKANTLSPDDAAISDSLGWGHFLRGEVSLAIPVLERASAADPQEAAISEHLGDAYWTVGRRIDARYAWRAALVQADGTDASRLTQKIDIGLGKATRAP